MVACGFGDLLSWRGLSVDASSGMIGYLVDDLEQSSHGSPRSERGVRPERGGISMRHPQSSVMSLGLLVIGFQSRKRVDDLPHAGGNGDR